MVQVAAALSEHPSPAQAAGEVVGALYETLGSDLDLVVLFATTPVVGLFGELAEVARTALAPAALFGVTSALVHGGPRTHGPRSAISALGLRLDTSVSTDPARAVVLDPAGDGPLAALVGAAPGSSLLLALHDEPERAAGLLTRLRRHHPEVAVLGVDPAPGEVPGGVRLLADDAVLARGAVGVLLDPTVPVVLTHASAYRPVGPPLVVTRAAGTFVEELDGGPALDRFLAVASELNPDDRSLLAAAGALVVLEGGPLASVHGAELHELRGMVRDRRALALDGAILEGTEVGLAVLDPATAPEGLADRLVDAVSEQRRAGVVFTDQRRTTHFTGQPETALATLDDILYGMPLAGCSGAATYAGTRRLTSTASVLLLG